MILAPGHHIPHGRPYRYHPNWPVHMMTARKTVGPVPTHRLAVRHSVDYSSLDHFTSDDSLRDSSSSSSSETSSYSPSDDLSDSSSSHSSYDHSLPALPSFSQEERSPTTSVLRCSPILGALSPARADLLSPPKRIKSSGFVTDLEDCLDESSKLSVPRETSLRDDVVVRGNDKPHLEQDINLEIQAKIDEYIAYADALRARGINFRVVVEGVDREDSETGTRGKVEVRVERVTHPALPDDIPKPAQEARAIEVTYETLGDLVQRFHDYTKEIPVCRVQDIEGV
nr:hypothetical protein [Tanacetum cinerariifolium]